MSRTSLRWLAIGLVLLFAVPAAAQNKTAQQLHALATNNKQDCIQHWRGVGWPRYAAPARERNATTVCHFRFVLSHNNTARSPDWVIERLDNQTLVSGGPDRPGQTFVPDLKLPERARASDDDYKKNHFGFARGHMAPAEDFNNDIDEMKASFILSNAVPQIDHGFNGSVWRSLEQAVRDTVLARRERNEL